MSASPIVKLIVKEPKKDIKLKITKLKKPEPLVLPLDQVEPACRKLINIMLDHTDKNGRILAEPFLTLPSRRGFPDYFRVIKNPISFNEIQKKKYTDMEVLKKDVLLIFSNCKIYNQPGSIIFQDAADLEALFLEAYHEITPEDDMDVDFQLDPATTALFEAIAKSDVKKVEICLDAMPGKVNHLFPMKMYKSLFTWSPLHAASFYGSGKVCELLVEMGAEVELEDTWYGGRALAWAAFGNHPKICKLLIERFAADKSAKNTHGQTAADLVPDLYVPAWRSVFLSEPLPKTPIVKQESNARRPFTEPPLDRRRPESRHTPLTFRIPADAIAASRTLSNDNSMRTPMGSLSFPRAFARKQEAKGSTNQGPRPMPTMSAYSQYASQFKGGLPTEYSLVSSIGLVTNDELFQKVIAFAPNDAEKGYLGYSVVVPKETTSVVLRVTLNSKTFPVDPMTQFQCTGFQNMVVYVPNPIAAVNAPLNRQEPLVFKLASEIGDMQDCSFRIYENLNSIEMIVSANISDSLVYQSVGLFITRL